jgi:hypothetical protein
VDKLEQYLDQVCRSIGGPKSLRQHVRQELREHLKDAAAGHKAAGLSEDEALNKALADFGGPEEVRSELEATHGHRLLPVVIDKAMQWKEKTMRAKWLWTTWAYIAVILVIGLEFFYIAFAEIYLVPKFKKLREDGYMGDAGDDATIQWLYSFLDRVGSVLDYVPQILLGALVLWGLFEWRVRSENKTLMRLSALGSGSLALMVVVSLMMAALVLPFMLGIPGNRVAQPWALETASSIERSVSALEQAAAKKDWVALKAQAQEVARGVNRLSAGPYGASLNPAHDHAIGSNLYYGLKATKEAIAEIEQTIEKQDVMRLESGIEKFKKAYEPLKDAAKRVGK